MPGDPTALFSLGNTISEGINQFGQTIREDMLYKRSKADAIEFWNMQNAYNAPQAQMQRLKAAGLNPHLVYGGSGSVGGQAGTFQTPVNPNSPDRRERRNTLLDYYDVKLKAATLSNVLAQNEAIREEAALKRAQTRDLTAGASRKEFDLAFEGELRTVSGDARRAALQKLIAETEYSLDENERRAALTGRSIIESVERVLTMRLQRAHTATDIARLEQAIKLLNQDASIREMQKELLEIGVAPGSNSFFSIIGTTVRRILDLTILPE